MAPASGLDGKAPVDWVGADGPDEELADAYAEATGLRLTALTRVFPGLKSISANDHLVRFLGLDTVAQLAKNMEATRALVDSPSLRVMMRAAEDVQRAYSPGLVAMLSAAASARPALEAALAWSPSVLTAVTTLRSSALPYAELASIEANLNAAAMAGISWDRVRPAALEGLMAVRPLLSSVDLNNLGLLSSSLWAEVQFAPAVGAALERWQELADPVNAEAMTFACWLPHADLSVAKLGLASSSALGITTHIRSRAIIATLAPGWQARDDSPAISAAVEMSASFKLPLDLEIPGAGATLREVMERRLPRTLAALETLAAVLNADMPNGSKIAAFAFRDALREFYSEVTGEPAAKKADRLRSLLATQLQQTGTGEYLSASIQLLEDVYKPAGNAVYGRGGDRASFSLWTQSAVAAMATIVTSWLEANPESTPD